MKMSLSLSVMPSPAYLEDVCRMRLTCKEGSLTASCPRETFGKAPEQEEVI
jgi:hypothetical protein